MGLLDKIFKRKTSKDFEVFSENKFKESVLIFDENKIPSSDRNIVIPYYPHSKEIIKNYHIKKLYPYGWDFKYKEKLRDRYFDENPSKCSGMDEYGFKLTNDWDHYDKWVTKEEENLESEKTKKISNYIKSDELKIELNKSEEIFQLEEEQSYIIGKKLYKNKFHKSVNGSLISEIERNIFSLNKKFKVIKSEKFSEQDQLINIYKKIVWFGYYYWFWNKCFSEEGYELREFDWGEYCLQRYGTKKDKDGDDLCSGYLTEYIDIHRKKYKYPKSVITDKELFDWYFGYHTYYKDRPNHLITGEYNLKNKEFDVIRYWFDDYIKKIRNKQETKIEWDLNIERTFRLIYNKLFNTDKKLPSNTWNISRNYPLGKTFTLMKDYIIHKKNPKDIFTLFDCLVKWENGILLTKNDKGYNNQEPLWIRWNKIIPHFRKMGKYLIKKEGGVRMVEK